MVAWAVASIISWRVKNGASPQGKAEVATKPHWHYFNWFLICLRLNLKDHSSGFLHIVPADNYNNTANHNLKHANQTVNFLHIPDIHYSL